MAEQWYVQLTDGKITGPHLERDVSTDLLSGRIGDDQKVRQGVNGPWCEASRARAVFRQLADVGWYVRSNATVQEEVFGPFTDAKLLELHRVGDLELAAEVRQGTNGTWKSATALLSLWENQKVADSTNALQTNEPDEGSVDAGKWSVEPMRHTILDLEVRYSDTADRCDSLEHLLLKSNDDENMGDRLLVTRTNGQPVGYLSSDNSRQIVSNAERGLSHVTLLYSAPKKSPNAPVQVAVVLCPTGSLAETCKQYIDQHFRGQSSHVQ